MKKIAKFITSIMLCIVCACMIVACDEKKIASIELEDNTLRTKIYVGQELDTSKVVVTVTYEDKTTKKVKSAELEFSTIDTSKAGTEKLTITYKDFSVDVNITILAPGTSDTVAYFGSDLINAFKDKGSAKTEKNTEFTKLGITHKTGDDNALDLGIRTEGLDETDSRVDVDADIVFTFKIWDETANEWKELLTETEDTAVKYATYIEGITNTTVDFTEAAVGKKFEITAKLADSAKYDKGMIGDNPQLRLVTDVIDGYNVYNTRDLSLYDNYNEKGHWTDLKTQWGLLDVASPNALILQRDINITDADIPASNFWTQEELYNNGSLKSEFAHDGNTYAEKHAIGSMKDEHRYIYCRAVADEDNFAMYGNYFDINAQSLTKAVYGLDTDDSTGKYWYVDDAQGANSYVCMHKTLFKVHGTQRDSNGKYDEEARVFEKYASQGTAIFQDINFIGNGKRSKDPKDSGGVILCKARGVNFTADNTIAKDFNIIWFTEYGANYTGAATIDSKGQLIGNELQKYIAMEGNDDKVVAIMEQNGQTCTTKNAKYTYTNNKGYNSYNTHFYFWGGNVYMENNIMHGAGGPVMIADHVSDGYIKHVPQGKDTTMWIGGQPTYINIVNCDYESMVNGQEPWFVTFGTAVTSVVSKFSAIDAMYAESTKTMLNDGHMNMILIYKHGKKEMADAGFSRGYCRAFDSVEDYNSYYATGKLADGSSYYGYDRSIDWTKSNRYLVSKGVLGDYAGGAAQANLTSMLNNSEATPAEEMRYENSTTGISDDVAKINKNTYGGKYLNLYMSNGFGAMFKMYDRQ